MADPLIVLALISLVGLFMYMKRPKHYAPLPPGPKKLPLIGNLLDMPTSFEWETYDGWCRELGVLLAMLSF